MSLSSFVRLAWLDQFRYKADRAAPAEEEEQTMKVSGKLQQRDGEDDKVQERKDEGRRGGRQKERKMKSGF